jgi:mono/diheme cytochrome c family protein
VRPAAAVVLAAALAAACGPSRVPPPADATARTVDTREERRGERVYMRHCNHCHPGGAAGLGPSLNDKPLPKALVRTQVRQGLGAMPPFDAQRIPDGDLDAVAEYVEALREGRDQPTR